MSAASWKVYDYQSGAQLAGKPTARLVAESQRWSSGAVCAVWTRGEWDYVPSGDAASYAARGETVRTVWVEA